MNILILDSLIECLCIKYPVYLSKWRVELEAWELADEIIYSFILLMIYFAIVCFWPMPTIWITRLGLNLSFYLSKKVHLCSRYGFFYHNFTYFVLIGVIEFPKLTSNIFVKNCDHSICPGWSVLFLYVLDHNTYLNSMHPNPILDRREGGGKKGSLPVFPS